MTSLPVPNWQVPESIASALKQGEEVDDPSFDRIYPGGHRFRSRTHWTPVEIALRACKMLEPADSDRILDIGSGVGKLCLIGALTSPGSWVGIEQDASMVRAATIAARALGVDGRVEFRHGSIDKLGDKLGDKLRWGDFTGFYLFNPFEELLYTAKEGTEGRRKKFRALVEHVEEKLSFCAPGTRVVTYHGMGGEMPSCFELVRKEPARDSELCLWVRRQSPSSKT